MTTRTRRRSLALRATALGTFALPLLVCTSARAQYTLHTLFTFDNADGQNPNAGLAVEGNDIYGSTEFGGTGINTAGGGLGTVFKYDVGTNQLTTVASFTGAANGQLPMSGPTLLDGNLFGSASGGGSNGWGTAYEIVAGSSTITVLNNFSLPSGGLGVGGVEPFSGLTADGSGNLFGTTEEAGTDGGGTVYELAAGTYAPSSVANFVITGFEPRGPLTLFNGNFYGTTYAGGPDNQGTVFEFSPLTDNISILADFTGANGGQPTGNLTFDSSGNLYGTAENGGSHLDGTVFEIAAGTNTIDTLVNFDDTNGRLPTSGMVLDGSGDLFGTTFFGGAGGSGTVFEIANGSNTLKTIATFANVGAGEGPNNLILESNGDILGTTYAGGANADGTIFELSPASGSAPEPGSLALLAGLSLPVLAGVR